MKTKLKSLATKIQKPKKAKRYKAAYLLAVKLMAELDNTEKF